MPGRVRRMNSRAAESILSRHGFVLVSQKGSHRKWRNAATRLQVTVPDHRGRDLPLGTLRSIMQGAQIPEAEWAT